MVDVTRVHEILERHGARRERMIAILLDCQEEYYHLPREVLEAVSAEVQVPLTSVISIATFFKAFSPNRSDVIRYASATGPHATSGRTSSCRGPGRELNIRKGETTRTTSSGLTL